MTAIPRAGRVVQAAARTLTVKQLALLIGDGQLADESPVLVDGRDVKIATDYAGVLYMDTGAHLPNGCPACGGYGCDCDLIIEAVEP